MLLTLLQFFASKFLVLALHLEAGSFPRPLSPQEEIRTFADLRAGDSSAREKLIRHNLRLVAHIAKKYYALPSEQDDLISIGTIGLMKAVDTFDSTRRARFSTYASRCIENELRMHFRRERKNAPTLSLQETLDAGKEDSALTLADVLQDGFCMEDSCEKQDDAQRLRRLLFVAVVNDTGRIAADQNNRQIRLDLPAGDFFRQPVPQTFGNRLAVNNLCRHIPCSILANAGGRLRRRF